MSAIGFAPNLASAQAEDVVKANYLVRFAAFVEWPPAAFATPAAPIRLCIAGVDPFGQALDALVAKQRIGGRTIAVRRLAVVDPKSGCHMVYVGRSARQSVAQLKAELAAAPVLIVTDGANGPGRGHIHFALEDSRVRFHADDEAAKEDGLSISSRLLALALSVRTAS